MRCSHIGNLAAWLIHAPDREGCKFGAVIVRDIESLLSGSAATGTEGEMLQHFDELDELLRSGSLEAFLKSAAKMEAE